MLGEDLDVALVELRAHAESAMSSRAVVRRATDETAVIDRMQVPVWEAVHTDLPFALALGTGSGDHRGVTIGDVTYEQATAIGKMPAATHDLADGDLIDVTDGEWAGSVYRIVKAIKKDRAAARKVPVVEVSRPKEWDA